MKKKSGAPKNKKVQADLPSVQTSLQHNHEPNPDSLLKTYQANLLSLISHELRTPLTGIMNALQVLRDTRDYGEFTAEELVAMAHRNALRLQDSLSALLDLAALDSGTFRVHLREVDLHRIAETWLKARQKSISHVQLVHQPSEAQALESPVLADPQKVNRALDLCAQMIASMRESDCGMQVTSNRFSLSLSSQIKKDAEKEWDQAWNEGVSSKRKFGEVLQSETGFLTRAREGLGSEFYLANQILNLHRGELKQSRKGSKVNLTLQFPVLSPLEGLKAVLLSRAYESSVGVGSVAFALLKVPEKMEVTEYCSKIRSRLFRSTDSVYSLPESRRLALIMDDCKREDAPRILSRIEAGVQAPLVYGSAICPEEGTDPDMLIQLAERRLK